MTEFNKAIVEMLKEGQPQKQIADKLHISVRMLQRQIRHIKDELKVETIAQRLAVELHRHYRAAEKAFNTTDGALEGIKLRHDHGWAGCHRQKYFLKRAERVIRYSRIQNADTLGEAEQALDAHILVRRSIVEGKPN